MTLHLPRPRESGASSLTSLLDSYHFNASPAVQQQQRPEVASVRLFRKNKQRRWSNLESFQLSNGLSTIYENESASLVNESLDSHPSNSSMYDELACISFDSEKLIFPFFFLFQYFVITFKIQIVCTNFF